MLGLPFQLDLQPSYYTGFAHNEFESAYPGLWKGLVGAWVPALGVTGFTLRDVSGFNNHGTIDPVASSWVIGNYPRRPGYALHFTTTNDDRVIVSDPPSGVLDIGTSDDFTMVIVFNRGDSVGTDRVISKGGHSNTIAGYVLAVTSDDALEIEYSNGITKPISSASSAGIVVSDGTTWHHVVTSINRSVGFDIWLDKINVVNGSIDTTSDNFDSTQDLNLGQKSDGLNDFPGDILYILLYKRAWTLRDVIFDYYNPLALFILRDQLFVRAPAAAGADVRRHIIPAYMRAA